MAVVPYRGSLTSHYFVAETTPGVTPGNPSWSPIRMNSGVPSVIRDTLLTDELNESAEITSVRVGNEQVNGEFTVDLSYGSHDDLLANALKSSWTPGVAIVGVEITVDDATKTFTRTVGDFVVDGVLVGDIIKFPGLTGNNSDPFIVTAVSPSVVTGAAITKDLIAEVATTDFSTSDKLETGNGCGTLSILTIFRGSCGTPDLYALSRGVELSGFAIEFAVNANTTGTFPFIGRNQEYSASAPDGSTFNGATTSRQYTGVDGKALVDGALRSFVTGATITNDNEASAQFELGDKAVSFVERGRINNTISMTAFLCDSVTIEKFLNEEQIDVQLLTSIDGSSMAFRLPRTSLTADAPEIGGQTTATESLEGTATGDIDNSSIVIHRLS